MSLETLIEAAEYIDCERDKNGRTRVNHTDNFHPYAKLDPDGNTFVKSPKSITGNQKRRQRHQSATSSCSTEDEIAPPRSPAAIHAGTRDLHNRLEKNRRAQLKKSFEALKTVIPQFDDDRAKASNLLILRSSTKHIQALKRQEKELEIEMQKLARQKIMAQERISALKVEVHAMNLDVDLSCFIPKGPEDDDAHSTASTATADNDEPIMSDDDGHSSSTLSTTSTPGKYSGDFKVPTPGSPQKLSRSLGAPVTMHSILNRTLLGASTNVLNSLTSTSPSSVVRPLGTVVKNIGTVKAAVQSQKINKSSVNQILGTKLQQRLQQAALQPEYVQIQAIEKQEKPWGDTVESASFSPHSVVQSPGGGTIITYGPATVAKLVPEKQANCDITTGIELSSLAREYLDTTNTVTTNTLNSAKSSTAGNWSNPSSIVDGQARTTIQFSRLLPSLFNTTATTPKVANTVTATAPVSTALTAQQLKSIVGTPSQLKLNQPVAMAAGSLGQQQNAFLTLQPMATNTAGISSSSLGRSISHSNNTLAAAVLNTPAAVQSQQQPMQAQMITPAQLQQLLLQNNTFSQQLFSAARKETLQQPTLQLQPTLLSPAQNQTVTKTATIAAGVAPTLLQPQQQLQKMTALPTFTTTSTTCGNNSQMTNTIQLAAAGARTSTAQLILVPNTYTNSTTQSLTNQLNLTALPLGAPAATTITIANHTPSLVSSTATTNSNQFNFSTLPLAQFIQPLAMVSPTPNVQLSTAGTVGASSNTTTVLTPQMLKTLGFGTQLPIFQPSALTVPMKPVVMVSMPSVGVPATQPSILSTTTQVLTPKNEPMS